MKLLIKIIFLYILYSCDNYCGCCCNCCQNCFWVDKGNEGNDLNKTQQHNVNEGNEVNDEDKNIEEEVDKIINGQYKDINDEELKQVVKEILLIEKYGSCIVCKDTRDNTFGIDYSYDFEQNQYIYVYDGNFNYRHKHICMSMLAKRRDTNKILGNLYRKGVVGYILKPESDSYLIGDGFINYQRKDESSNMLIYIGLCNKQYAMFEETKYTGMEDCKNFIEVAKKEEICVKKAQGSQLKLRHILYDYYDSLNEVISDKLKKSKRMYLRNTAIGCNTGNFFEDINKYCEYLFTNLSLLLAKDDEKCYRLKDDIAQDDNSPFVDVNLEDTLSTEIKIVGEEKNKYYDNIFFYKPTKNFFKNACNTGCLNNNMKIYTSVEKNFRIEENKCVDGHYILYNEIPIVPIKKVNNNNSDEIKYTLECIDLFVDMRTQNKKDEDERKVKHYNTALQLLENKNKKYVIVLTDEYFVIDTVKNLLGYFKNKDKGGIFSELDLGKNYKINYNIDFNKRYKTEN